MKKLASRLIPICIALCLAPTVVHADCIVLTEALAYLPGGKAEVTNIVIQGERITHLGMDSPVPVGCKAYDASGKTVTAGLTDPATFMGLVEVELEPATVDSAPGKDARHVDKSVHPSFRISDAYNPLSTLIPIARVAGITSTITHPRGGSVHGQAAWVDMAGDTQAKAVRNSSLAITASVGGSERSRAIALHHIRYLLEESKAFAQKKNSLPL